MKTVALSTEFDSKPWGEANDRRGKGHTDLAKVFVKDHPIGTALSADTLDEWMAQHGMLELPLPEAPKNSDAWMGHLQRRHIMRGRLNKAGTHPRMSEEGSMPFIITAIKGGYEVRSPEIAASKAELPRKISRLTQTKRQQLAYLMQSADWSALPPHERSIAETIYDDIDAFTADIKTDADRISRKLAKLEHRIRLALEAGEIKPRNHGIQGLLESSQPHDEQVYLEEYGNN
jgi:hypothetical protein